MNLDKSVNCYFCGVLKDEKDCIHADEYNENDGGSICHRCLTEIHGEEILDGFYDELRIKRKD